MTSERDIRAEKEEISRQQYWYTTTVLAFVALVANVVKPTNPAEFCILILMIVPSMCLGIYMVVVCHREYLDRDNRKMGWWRAFRHSFIERKGAFFCNVLILCVSIGLSVLLASRAAGQRTVSDSNLQMKSLLNSAGVFLAVVGAFLIWCVVVQLNVVSESEYLKGQTTIDASDPTPSDIKKFKIRKWLSKIGIALVVLGGALQIISNYW